ncbi:MAG: DUF3549 family protein [Gammaproteobacteria bacterium]|nr:DUF3549 family protein [Gammaproteobacteria bacterium]
MTSQITSLVEFFEQTGIKFRIFDMGRRVSSISKQQFFAFEQGKQPYPMPLQLQAWIGILGWPGEDTSKHFIWFLKMPLDESGNINYAARDDLLHRLVQIAEAGLQGDSGPDAQQSMEDNPYGFKPNDDRMAVFHAKALKSLAQPASQFYRHTQRYFSGQEGWDQWSSVGMQGIADMVVRLEEEQNATIISKAIPQLPLPPLEALAKCLENEAIPTSISEALVQRVETELKQQEPELAVVSLCIRAMSCAPATGLRQQLLEKILQTPMATSVDLLVSIAGRAWEDLKQAHIRLLFLEALANNPAGQEVFNKLMADLFFIPGMREELMQTLREPERSDTLAQAIGQFFAAIRSE